MLTMNSKVKGGDCVTPMKFRVSRVKASAEKKSMMRNAVFHADRSSSGLVRLNASWTAIFLLFPFLGLPFTGLSL